MLKSLIRTHEFIFNHPIAGKNKTAAYMRWLSWQIESRFRNTDIIKAWIDDALLSVQPGMTGATGNLYSGLHEFEDMAILLHYYSGGGDLFVDIGANIGSYTILASKICRVHSLSIEPVPSTFYSLQRNIDVNNINMLVELHCSALGSGNGELLFSIDDGPMNRAVDMSYCGKMISVPMRSLDLLLNGRRSGFWKVDVEGFERQVLDGAASSLFDESLQIVLLEGCDDSICRTMDNAGFQQSIYNPFTREISYLNKQQISGNNLWVRDSDALRTRLKNAKKRKIHGVIF